MAVPKASYFEATQHDNVVCTLCPLECTIAPNRSGACGVRTNRRGDLVLDTYGRISVLEPVIPERLPLFHHQPHLRWLLVGQRGCNMRCPFCTTAKYSQLGGVPQESMTPDELVEQAALHECGGISFGIAEPVVSLEFLLDVFAQAKAAGLRRHVATNGFLQEEPLRDLVASIDALTVGIKSVDEGFYNEVTGGGPDAVRHAVEVAVACGLHVEVSYLVIAGRTDRAEDAEHLMELLQSTGVHHPPILLPFEPSFQWKEMPAAPLAALENFRRLLAAMGSPAYVAHPESAHLDTRCPRCGRVLVRRAGTQQVGLDPAAVCCPHCRAPLPFTL